MILSSLPGGPARRDSYARIGLISNKVVEFPRLPAMQQVTLKVIRWEEREKHLVIKEAKLVS